LGFSLNGTPPTHGLAQTPFHRLPYASDQAVSFARVAQDQGVSVSRGALCTLNGRVGTCRHARHFARLSSPVARNVAAGLEIVMARWGLPSSPVADAGDEKARAKVGGKGKPVVDFKELLRLEPDSCVTNIRNVSSKHWQRWSSLIGAPASALRHDPRCAQTIHKAKPLIKVSLLLGSALSDISQRDLH
jgi:hypothetical protein